MNAASAPLPSASVATHVVAIDDDPGIRQLIFDYLGDNDIRVTPLPDGSRLDQVLQEEVVDIVILDLKLPGEDGMQIAGRLRQVSALPIIMLTARSHEADRVMGLELGADYYLTKPFSPRELLARVRALLRRTRQSGNVAAGLSKLRGYRFAGWELNLALRKLSAADGRMVALSKVEFNLLAAFLAAPQQVLSRDRLLDLSRMHRNEIFDRSIDVQIARLRKKIDAPQAATSLIKTERGSGYVFTAAIESIL